jgi:hypothetical protein
MRVREAVVEGQHCRRSGRQRSGGQRVDERPERGELESCLCQKIDLSPEDIGG